MKAFWEAYDRLPDHVQRQAKSAFDRWRDDPFHPSLEFKRIHRSADLWSVRVGIAWRALAHRRGDAAHWFWIGSRAEYNRIIRTK